MSKQLCPVAAALAIGLIGPLSVQADPLPSITINFNDAISAASDPANDASLTSEYSSTYHITFGVAPGKTGAVHVYNASNNPSDISPPNGTDPANPKASGFVGGTNFTLTFDLNFYRFDVLEINVTGGGLIGGQSLSAFAENGDLLGGVSLQYPVSGSWEWNDPNKPQVTIAGGFNGDVATLKVLGTAYIDNLTLSCTDPNPALCVLPTAGTGPTPAPEPASFGLAALALLGAGFARRARSVK